MAILEGSVSGTLAGVGDEAQKGLHVVLKPTAVGSLGSYAVGTTSGIMVASLAAGSEVFQFRWPDATRLAVVTRVVFDCSAATAATTAAQLIFLMTVARAWTVAGSGGTRLTLTGNNAKLRTSMGTSLVNDAGISTTAALTAGTKTLDTSNIASLTANILTGALTIALSSPIVPPGTVLFDHHLAGYPLVLAQNEGFAIRTGANFPAGATWVFGVTVYWSEVSNF